MDISVLVDGVGNHRERKVKLGVYAMKRVAAGAHLLISFRCLRFRFRFSSMRNAQTIEPTTVCTVVSSTNASTRYKFVHLSGVRRAIWANSGEDSAQ